jgi:HNH endonuclease/AP2 domain
MSDFFNYLKDKYQYSESSKTGLIYKKVIRPSKVKLGDEVGGMSDSGYWCTLVSFNSKKIRMYNHKIIMILQGLGINKNECIDHIDGVRSNNKINNLRIIKKEKNSRNAKKARTNTTGFAGVSKNVNGYYVAHITDLTGKLKRKYFSINKLTEEKALVLAKEWRENEIEKLNLVGAGYTERHGS